MHNISHKSLCCPVQTPLVCRRKVLLLDFYSCIRNFLNFNLLKALVDTCAAAAVCSHYAHLRKRKVEHFVIVENPNIIFCKSHILETFYYTLPQCHQNTQASRKADERKFIGNLIF